MPNLNIYLDLNFENMFKELKFLLKSKTNKETQEKIIEIAYKDLKKKEN